MDIVSNLFGIILFGMLFVSGLAMVVVVPVAVADGVMYIVRDVHNLYSPTEKVLNITVGLFFGTLTVLTGGALVVLIAEQVINHI